MTMKNLLNKEVTVQETKEKTKQQFFGQKYCQKYSLTIEIAKLFKRTLKSETTLGKFSPLKMMKNAFYFTLRARLILNIFKFLS